MTQLEEKGPVAAIKYSTLKPSNKPFDILGF